MMALAPTLGRLEAHELVTAACREARYREETLAEALAQSLEAALIATVGPLEDVLSPEAYLGETDAIVASALRHWEQRKSRPRNGDDS